MTSDQRLVVAGSEVSLGSLTSMLSWKRKSDEPQEEVRSPLLTAG